MRVLVLLLLPLVFGVPAQIAPTPPICTPAQHARFTAVGPNGLTYATWHPLVDAGGCVYDHEHGSDPALVRPGYKPLYGYSASAHGMEEAHPGFKGYAFRLDGYEWYIVQHQGTANAPKAACIEHHTLDIAIWKDGALVADLHAMPSFGNAVINRTGALVTGCPQTSTSGGVRQFPGLDAGNVGYEPWRVGRANTPFLTWGDLTFNTSNPQTACQDAACLASAPRTDAYGPAKGTYRFLKFESNNAFWLHATEEHQGTFIYGELQQYIAPGTDIRVSAAECLPFTAAMLYQCARDGTLRPLVGQGLYRLWPVTGPN